MLAMGGTLTEELSQEDHETQGIYKPCKKKGLANTKRLRVQGFRVSGSGFGFRAPHRQYTLNT